MILLLQPPECWNLLSFYSSHLCYPFGQPVSLPLPFISTLKQTHFSAYFCTPHSPSIQGLDTLQVFDTCCIELNQEGTLIAI
jgi:hypothetical protein